MADREETVEVHYLWPDCVLAWRHWQAVQTQWRTHATGLDYAGVRAYLDEQRFASRRQRREVFDCICAAERATLEVQADADSARPAPAQH